MAIHRQFLLAAAATLLNVACGSSTAAAGNTTPGGAPGNPCNAATAPVGCYADGTGATTIVNCPSDVSPATWTAAESCGAGTHCVLQNKTTATCAANPVVVVNDTVSSSDTKAGDAEDTSKCVQAKCATPINSCMTNVKCSTFLSCMSACPDSACQDNCATPVKNDAAATKVIQDLIQCSLDAGMTCQGKGGDAGTTDLSVP